MFSRPTPRPAHVRPLALECLEERCVLSLSRPVLFEPSMSRPMMPLRPVQVRPIEEMHHDAHRPPAPDQEPPTRQKPVEDSEEPQKVDQKPASPSPDDNSIPSSNESDPSSPSPASPPDGRFVTPARPTNQNDRDQTVAYSPGKTRRNATQLTVAQPTPTASPDPSVNTPTRPPTNTKPTPFDRNPSAQPPRNTLQDRTDTKDSSSNPPASVDRVPRLRNSDKVEAIVQQKTEIREQIEAQQSNKQERQEILAAERLEQRDTFVQQKTESQHKIEQKSQYRQEVQATRRDVYQTVRSWVGLARTRSEMDAPSTPADQDSMAYAGVELPLPGGESTEQQRITSEGGEPLAEDALSLAVTVPPDLALSINFPLAQKQLLPLQDGEVLAPGMEGGAGLTAAVLPTDTATLDAALEQFLAALEEVGETLYKSWYSLGAAPWLLALATGVTTYEVARRRRVRQQLPVGPCTALADIP